MAKDIKLVSIWRCGGCMRFVQRVAPGSQRTLACPKCGTQHRVGDWT